MTTPGSFPDPAGVAPLRFWNGQEWTAATTHIGAGPYDFPTRGLTTESPASWSYFGYPPASAKPTRSIWFEVVAFGLITLSAATVIAAVILALRQHYATTSSETPAGNPIAAASSGDPNAPGRAFLNRLALTDADVVAATQTQWQLGLGYPPSIDGDPTGCPGIDYGAELKSVSGGASFAAGDDAIEEVIVDRPGSASVCSPGRGSRSRRLPDCEADASRGQ